MGDDLVVLGFLENLDQAMKAVQDSNRKKAMEGAAGKGLLEAQGLPPRAHKDKADIDACEASAPTLSKESAMTASAKGHSILNSLYEIVAHAGKGTTTAKDFPTKLGAAANQLDKLGVTAITRNDDSTTITLREQVPIGDDSGKVLLGNKVDANSPKDSSPYYVTFTPEIYGGSATLRKIDGVVASNSLGSAPVSSIDLQPRESGNISATLHTSWTDVNICAFTDNKIVH